MPRPLRKYPAHGMNAFTRVIPKGLAFEGQSAANSCQQVSAGAGVMGYETADALPTVTGFSARQAIAALRRRNIAVAPLLRRAGLSERDFAGSADNDGHPNRRLPAAGQSRFFDLAAEALADSDFGLHLAEQADPRDAGILFYVASGAKDLEEALSLFARYFRIVNEAVRLRLRRTTEAVFVEVEFVGVPRHQLRQNAEFGVAVILKALREIARRNIHPGRVVFSHARSSHSREFERFFGCPVEFGRVATEGASSDLMEFSSDTLAVPLSTADAKMIAALQPFCDMAAKERGTANGTLRAAVENEVEKLLPHGKAQARTVAKLRALQRV